MNEIDIAISGGCIGGPHTRGTVSGCAECVPFQPTTTDVHSSVPVSHGAGDPHAADPVMACWRVAQDIGGAYLSTHYLADFLNGLKARGWEVKRIEPD